jgi:capsid protein
MIDHFCDLVYELWMEEAVLRERIIAPGFLTDPLLRKAFLGNLWIGPAAGQIDPTKETAAAQARVDGFFSNISIESAAMGIDFDQNVKQIKREQTKLAEIREIMSPQKTLVSSAEEVDDLNENVDNILNEETEDDNKK